MKRSTLYILIVCLVAFCILMFSTQTGIISNAPNVFVVERLQSLFGTLSSDANWWITFVIRKMAHVTEYFLFYCVLMLLMNKTTKLQLIRKLNYCLAIGIAIALLDEYVQSFIPGRMSKITDVLIDSIGLMAGYIIIYFKSKKVH